MQVEKATGLTCSRPCSSSAGRRALVEHVPARQRGRAHVHARASCGDLSARASAWQLRISHRQVRNSKLHVWSLVTSCVLRESKHVCLTTFNKHAIFGSRALTCPSHNSRYPCVDARTRHLNVPVRQRTQKAAHAETYENVKSFALTHRCHSACLLPRCFL